MSKNTEQLGEVLVPYMPFIIVMGATFAGIKYALGLIGGGAASGILVTFGFVLLAFGCTMLYLLPKSRHGLLDPRTETRYDVLGDVATREQKPGILERIISFTSVARAGDIFGAFVLKQIGAISREDFGREMMFRLRDAFKDDKSPLLRGDLKAFAEQRWSHWKDEFGEWQGQFEMHVRVPDDMELCPFNHDKLISGDDVSLMAYRYLTRNDLRKAYGFSLQRVQETASYVPLNALALGLGVAMALYPMMSTFFPQWEFFGFHLLGFLVSLFSGAALATGAGLLVLTKLAELALHVRSVAAFAQHKVNCDESLRTATMAIVRNKEEEKNPGDGIVAYRNALRMALKDRTPGIQLGVATGHALLHGASPTNAYSEGQSVRLTIADMTVGGVVILGGTGSGKSYSIIIPLMAQIMRAPFDNNEIAAALAGGYKVTASIVTYDPKAALHWDATALARDCGWFSRNIGTGDGEFGLDLFDGISAVIVSAILNEAVSQKSGGAGGSDPFWGSMAAKIRYAAAVIARVYELTDKGVAEVERTGERIYSPVGVYKIAMSCRDADGYLMKVVDTIYRNMKDPKLVRYIAPLAGPELIAAIDFLRRDVLKLFSENTVGGFLANVSDSLADFVSESDIRERFGAARGNILDMDRLWDHKTVTNFRLSKFKYGDVATVITMMSKIRQYHWAAVRLETNPALAKMSKQIVFIDEAQELVTKGGTFSEAQFINMSRAMSMSFVLATQTWSALVEAMGSDRAVDNMMAQLRSKVFLGTEDPATLKYLQEITGYTLQTHIHNAGQYESRLVWRKAKIGSIAQDIVIEDTCDEDMLQMTHPLIHGRVEPLMRGQADQLKAQFANAVGSLSNVNAETQMYEAMYVYGEEYIKKFTPGQGRVTKFMQNILTGGVQNTNAVPDPSFTLMPIYPSLKLAVGGAVIVANRATLMRHDMVRLTHQLGFMQNKEVMDVEDKKELQSSDLKSHAIDKISKQRADNAVVASVAAAAAAAAKKEKQPVAV